MHPIRAEKNIAPILCKVMGEAARKRGIASEDSILRAFEVAHVPTPIWFRGIERASYELDVYEGVDFVVDSDIGKLYLQVKSSNLMANEFRRKQECRKYNQYIAIVSLEGCRTDEERCLRVFHVVGKKRLKLLNHRGQVQFAKATP